jgi:hypothetical protein
MDIPILLFLGTEDRIVGDVNVAKAMGEKYPTIQIEELCNNLSVKFKFKPQLSFSLT